MSNLELASHMLRRVTKGLQEYFRLGDLHFGCGVDEIDNLFP